MTAMTLDDAVAHVLRTDARFALGEAVIRGVPLRVFSAAPRSLRDMMVASGPAHPGADDYLVAGDQRWTYAAFCDEVGRVGRVLTGELGVRRGEPVAIAMRNHPEILVLMMAVASVGAVAVMLNAWWTREELEYGLADCAARVVFADGPRAERIAPYAAARGLTLVGVRDGEAVGQGLASLTAKVGEAAWSEAPIEPDDDFAVFYSSGSTGRAKGVVLTHRGAISAVWSWLMASAVAPLVAPASAPAAPRRPSFLVVTPLFHVTASHPLFLLSIPLGAKVVLLAKWDADEAVRLIEREAVTRFLGVPTQSADLMEAARRLGATLPSLESVTAGGAKRPAAQVAPLAEAFPHAAVASGWGMTETNALGIAIGGPEYVARPGVAGRLLPPLQELRIVDGDGQEVPHGTLGELTVRSAANMRGYLNQPEATAEALRDGWLRTGDLATVDADGVVTIVDRAKSIIIRGGENISCLDVEGALHRHPAVVEAGVFPVPDARLGEVVGAAVQVRDGHALDATTLTAFLAEHIARYKIPERLWVASAPLPRGTTDKIDRRALRTACLDGALPECPEALPTLAEAAR
ncbi:class I adenylate-forming enzyme family protein [Acuticoccus sp.]|uniref:class I adenylate-forming enzyme family protein n=1 Tax=Acuticoccus sp. TaxID=1904378 RepID=UPI003B52E4E0